MENVDNCFQELAVKRKKKNRTVLGEGVCGQRLKKSFYYSRTNLNILLNKGKVRK